MYDYLTKGPAFHVTANFYITNFWWVGQISACLLTSNFEIDGFIVKAPIPYQDPIGNL